MYPNQINKATFSVNEVSRILNTTPATIYNYLRKGTLSEGVGRRGGKAIKVVYNDQKLTNFLQSQV